MPAKKKPPSPEARAAWNEVQGNKADAAAMMFRDAEEKAVKVPDKADLDKLTKSVGRLQELKSVIEKKMQELNDLSKEYKNISENEVPDIFDELGLSTITLADGHVVSVNRFFVGSISEQNQPVAHAWLEEHGHGAIIKKDVTVKLKKGDNELYEQVTEDLALMGVDYAVKEAVHAQTLKAFINEQMKAGANIPQDVFGIHPIRQTKITKK